MSRPGHGGHRGENGFVSNFWVDLGQQIFTGVALGGLYALEALGFSFIWSAVRVFNFAHGEFFMLGAFLAISLIGLGIPYIPALILAVGSTGVIGVLMERWIVRSVYKELDVSVLIVTIGMGIIFRNVAQIIWGTIPQAFPSLFNLSEIELAGIRIDAEYLGIFCISCCFLLGFYLFLKKTEIGVSLRAISQNRDVAALMGIRVWQSVSLTWFISTSLAAVAGVLMAPFYFLTTDMGFVIAVKGFAAATIGGLNSAAGAIIGGIIIGLVENLGSYFISSTYKDLFAFLVMIIVLLFKPEGLFGRRIEKF
jgi:branched-chain amino acid transport system permease protein